jgi:hypothetical protein
MSAAWWCRTGPRSGFEVDVDTVACQVVRDAFRDAHAAWWVWRAEQLSKGLSRPGDWRGNLTPEQVAARDERIRTDVARCLVHARLVEDPYPEDVAAVLAEVTS